MFVFFHFNTSTLAFLSLFFWPQPQFFLSCVLFLSPTNFFFGFRCEVNPILVSAVSAAAPTWTLAFFITFLVAVFLSPTKPNFESYFGCVLCFSCRGNLDTLRLFFFLKLGGFAGGCCSIDVITAILILWSFFVIVLGGLVFL